MNRFFSLFLGLILLSDLVFLPGKVFAANKTIDLVINNTFDSGETGWDLYCINNSSSSCGPTLSNTKIVFYENEGNYNQLVLEQSNILLPNDSESIYLYIAYAYNSYNDRQGALIDPDDTISFYVFQSGTSNLLLNYTYNPDAHDSGVTKYYTQEIPSMYRGSSVDLAIIGEGDGDSTYTRFYVDTANIFAGVNDITAPTGFVTINNGNKYTNSSKVNLNYGASDNESGLWLVGISNNRSNWDANIYGYKKTWNLISGSGGSSKEGMRTVYVQYVDVDQNISPIYSDTIIYDKTAPAGTIQINKNKKSSKSRKVTLTIKVSDKISGIDKMRISNNGKNWTGWGNYKTTYKNWDMTKSKYGGKSKKGKKVVYIQVRDKAGNIAKYSDSINYK